MIAVQVMHCSLLMSPIFHHSGTAFRLINGAFLATSKSGQLVTSKGPLRQDRNSKLFKIREVSIPPHALSSWPVRCHLRTRDNLYLSNSNGKLAANAGAPCCSEELIMDVGGIASLVAGTPASPCRIWSADATRIASVEPVTNQIVFQSQHSCTGHEEFSLQLCRDSEVTLAAGTSTSVVCSWPSVKCDPFSNKSTRLSLELASNKPVFFITAHGGCVSPSPSLSTYTTRLHAAPPPPPATTTANLYKASDFHAISWQLEHHGDSFYSIRHAVTKVLVYVNHNGTLQMDGSEPAFPDPRILFSIEPAWSSHQSDGDLLVGFTIRPMHKLQGRQLALSALPDGRITTCYRKAEVNRWEIFQIADRAAVLGSSAFPLTRLPQQQQEEHDEGDSQTQQQALRRSSSCHVIASPSSATLPTPTRVLPPSSSACSLSTSPGGILPGILENSAAESEEDGDWEEEAARLRMGNTTTAAPTPTTAPLHKGRRCQSESALMQMAHTPTPQWLADMRRLPLRPCGWGILSAASMQDHCCHTLCATALSQLHQEGMHGVEREMEGKEEHQMLPEEARRRVLARVAVVTSSPLPSKLSFQHLVKVSNSSSGNRNAPEWAIPLVGGVIGDGGEEGQGAAVAVHDMLPEEMAESYACVHCQGSSGLLLPLDPEINPRHHRFLQEMERRQFGGRRRRRGGCEGPMPSWLGCKWPRVD